jgi:hypothetical protein
MKTAEESMEQELLKEMANEAVEHEYGKHILDMHPFGSELESATGFYIGYLAGFKAARTLIGEENEKMKVTIETLWKLDSDDLNEYAQMVRSKTESYIDDKTKFDYLSSVNPIIP